MLYSRISNIGCVVAVFALLAGSVRADDADTTELAKEAHGILVNRCAGCHGDNKPRVAGRNVLDRETLLKVVEDEAWLVPGNAEESAIWVAISENYMPYDSTFASVPMPDEEKATLKKWIEAGAPFPGNTPRDFVTEKDVLQAINLDLFKQPVLRRDSLRYFSIHHLHNNYERVSVKELRLYRAALSKAVNSLTDESLIVIPRAVDEHETVFAVDIEDLGWDKQLSNGQTKWQRVVSAYPYGFEPFDIATKQEFDKIKELMTGNFDRVAYVRADWFVATATRPPLYHDILEIPAKLEVLEERLGVDRQSDFNKQRLLRAGVQESGVSAQNRLVDWHSMSKRSGSYWISYDFKFNSGRGTLARFPLGPLFGDGDDEGDEDDNEFADFAFEHDGGEVIFRLLNGMQGYMLTTDKGDRLRAGPVSIVWDVRNVSGTPEIVNGLSCMRCHEYGTRGMVDVIGDSQAVFNQAARQQMQVIYDNARFQEKLENDEREFLTVLEQVVGPFLKVEEDAGKGMKEFPEPTAFVALKYQRDMRLADVAYEIGLTPKQFNGNRSRQLDELGLRPLWDGAAIKRSMWAAIDEQFSPFHLAIRELSIGVPIAVENVEDEVDVEIAAEAAEEAAAGDAAAGN